MLCDPMKHVFMLLHLACHLGTLDEPREGRDGGSSRRWNDQASVMILDVTKTEQAN